MDRVCGNSNEWVLELKDGKRIRLPEGIRTVTSMEDEISKRVFQWIDDQRKCDSISTEEKNRWASSELNLAMVE